MIDVEHLCGIPFEHGKVDCYTSMQRAYLDCFGVVLGDYARPDDWWDDPSLNLYQDHFFKEGFRVLHDVPVNELQVGDGFLMAIKSPKPNHAAMYVGEGKIFHHFYGRLSEVVLYKGLWRNTTTAILRHKSINLSKRESTIVELVDVLPPHQRQKVLNAIAARQAAGK